MIYFSDVDVVLKLARCGFLPHLPELLGVPGGKISIQYLASLRDGREVYINGERIADVTTHPSMRNSARSLARLYDALHDPKRRQHSRRCAIAGR